MNTAKLHSVVAVAEAGRKVKAYYLSEFDNSYLNFIRPPAVIVLDIKDMDDPVRGQ